MARVKKVVEINRGELPYFLSNRNIFPYFLSVEKINYPINTAVKYESVGKGVEKIIGYLNSSSAYITQWMKELGIYAVFKIPLTRVKMANFVKGNNWLYENELEYCKELRIKSLFLDGVALNESYKNRSAESAEKYIILLISQIENVYEKLLNKKDLIS